MAQTPLGNMGINFEHTLGADDWKNSYDANWVITDWALQAFIIADATTAEPGSPQVGDAYILPSTQTGTSWGADGNAAENSIAIYANVPGLPDSSPWIYLVPREGWTVYDRTLNRWRFFNGSSWIGRDIVTYRLAGADLTTTLTTGTEKAYFRLPRAFTLTGVRASLLTASDSGAVTIDVNVNGSSVLTTEITIDVSEKTSQTAATPPVIDTAGDANVLSDDDEVTVDIDGAGSNAAGLMVTLIGRADD